MAYPELRARRRAAASMSRTFVDRRATPEAVVGVALARRLVLGLTVHGLTDTDAPRGLRKDESPTS